LIAFDATTGDQVWEFMTDAGANAPSITYEVDGKQYISIFSAGNSLAGTAHGDKIYTFSLEGKYGSLEDIPEDVVNTSPVANDHKTDDEKGHAEDEDLGLKTYENNCLACHGETGSGGHNGPVLKSLDMDKEAIINQIKNGGGGMPGFEGNLTEEEINAVTDYILGLDGG
jgi:quinohemoprotein ethanol dehydrogenase